MKEKVFQIISDHTGVDKKKLSLETDVLKDIEINSFDLMTMVVAFEDEFNIEINEQEIRKIRKISDIIEMLEKK